MTHQYQTVLKACGKVKIAVFVKAFESTGMNQESYRIAQKVLVDGYRQAVVAKHTSVSRQRVHSICKQVLDAVNAVNSEE